MKLKIGAVAAALAAGLVIAGCGDRREAVAPPPTNPPSTSASPAAKPENKNYSSAAALAADLVVHGIKCIPEPDTTSEIRERAIGKHDARRCALPVVGDPEGVPITLTVWPTETSATIGVAAWSRFLRSVRDTGPQTYYLLTGSNWMIDFASQRRAPEQVMDAFGGRLQIID